MDATNNIATDLFYKIRSRFTGLKLGAAAGNITINPEEARFFDFDYMEGQTPIGHVSISLAEPNSMKVYFSTGITESMNDPVKKNWYGFLRELRLFAKRRLMSFDTRDIAKDNLDKRDYAFLTQYSQPSEQTPVGESIMSESTMYGTKNVSYQKLEDTRLIIKHSHALADEMVPGARSRNISGLFVENADGERFKYPFIHLAGARAMQRHVANGGVPYDDIGKSIVGMSEEIAQLRNFGSYVVRNDLMNTGNNGIVERSTQYLNKLRERVKALSKQNNYMEYRESFQAQSPMEVPSDVVEQFTDQFTVRNFKEDIKSVFPVLYRLMQEDNTIGYDDIVAMTATEQVEEETESMTATDPFAKFENWVTSLGEESAIQSQDPEEQRIAIQKLQELVGQEFPVGLNGENAIESLRGVIEDPTLLNAIKETAKADPQADLRGPIQQWLGLYAPDVLEQVNFGDYTGESIEEADAPPARQKLPRYQWQSRERDPNQPPMSIKDPETGKSITNPEWSAWKDSEAGKADTAAMTAHSQQQLAQWKASYKANPKDFDTTMDIINPDFDVNADDDEPEEIEVGIDYEANVSGSYRPATWGYHGGEPEEHPDVEVIIHRVVDLETGEDITKLVDTGPIEEKLAADVDTSGDDDYDDYDRYESINPKNPRDYERPAKDRKDAGQPPLRMQDVKAKDTEHKRNFDARLGGDRPQKEGMDINVQEVAAFIHSFYDKASGTFPKGPEGVATMVGKKFGERAEQAARQMVERMAPQQSTEQNPELAELARIKQLSGM